MPAHRARLLLIITALVILLSLYHFYPSDHFRTPHAPSDGAYERYEAGGIDSEHYRAPVVPDFGRERVGAEECDGEDGMCGPEQEQGEGETYHALPHAGHAGAGGSAGGHGGGGGHGLEVMDEEARGEVDPPSRPPKQEPLGAGHGHGTGIGIVTGAGAGVSDETLGGGVIMPKLENATAKAELGRAAWRVLHLMTLRYPENPTADDRLALKSYFHLFSRLYPCGECATEFQALLKEYPPQTSSRKSASMWLCSVHNMVNERLGKPEFDCLTLNETYDCGCGPEGEGEGAGAGGGKGAGKDKVDGAATATATAAETTTAQTKDEDEDEYAAAAEPTASPVVEDVVDEESREVAEIGGDEWEALDELE